MQSIVQILSHTPAWVYVLFVYLIFRGIKARKPAGVTPLRLVLVPALLIGWGLYDLIRLYGLSATSLTPWLAALGIGAIIGWFLIRGRIIEVDRAAGVIKRPADYTVLPLIVFAFSIKYAIGVIAALSPVRLANPSFRIFDLTLSGILAGVFVGKLALYLTRYFSQHAVAGVDPQRTSIIHFPERER